MKFPIPSGYHTVTPSLVVKDAKAAIAFYRRAFGAEEAEVMTSPDGTVMHAELVIGESKLMLGEENPRWPKAKSAETIGASPVSLHLYVTDADAVYRKAIEAGATSEMAPENAFWGDRYAKVKDPFGFSWGIATRVKNMTPDEMKAAGEAWAEKQRHPVA